jgi:SpoVK/Ycf46/Vps4 family AAA+-type ATPase
MAYRDKNRAKRRRAGPARYEEQTVRWILRTLVHGGAAQAYFTPEGELASEGSRLLHGLGLSAGPHKPAARAQVLDALRGRLAELESGPTTPSFASHNAAVLGALLQLNRTETEVLAFAIALECESVLRDAFAELRARTHPSVCKQLARVLGRRASDVDRALSPRGTLRSVPVLQYVRADSSFEAPFGLASVLEPAMLRPLVSEADLVRHFLTEPSAATLALPDYPHLTADLDLLARYLRAALAERQRGVNVLLYGPPGTGKSELARVLAAHVGADLCEVNLEDGDGDPYEGSERLSAYALCQRMLHRRRQTLLLLDEVEDVFPSAATLPFALGSGSMLTKAWTNRLLECNPLPTFWISNAIDQIDRAYLRRFSYALEVGQPPRRVRRNAIERHAAGLRLRGEYLDQLAELEALSPAHVERAASFVRLLEPNDGAQAESDFERVVQGNLRAYCGSPQRSGALRSPLAYDLSLLEVDVDVSALIAGVRRHRRGAFCFYGPPGTGKSELARELARRAELPLLVQRGSDLLGKYVGETEQRIARMFERARRDGALLLLDEADGFLAERSAAHHSWEVTQVNELLVQLEQFEGVFVCTTNLAERLDRAALRRFALKVAFGYCRREQARALFARSLRVLGAPAPEERELAALDRLRVLTPGDFAAAVRGALLLDLAASASALLDRLSQACADKRVRGSKVLGFHD